MENFKRFCKEKSITFFFPISLILTIVPLIVRIKAVKNNPESLAVFGSKAQSDLFSQNKALALMFFTIIILVLSVIFFKKIFQKKDKIINSVVILSLVFLLLSLFSSLFSEYKNVAFWGIFDRAEGFVTIACYIIIFIYSIYTFNSTKNYRCLYIPIAIVVFINAFLGLFQFLGHDLMSTSLGQIFANVDPKSVSSTAGSLYGTLYHYNFVGSFAAIVIPVLIGSLFHEDDIFLKLVLITAIGCGFWLLFGSTSRAGLLGFGASILFAIIIFAKILSKHLKPVIITVVSILVILIGVNFATGGQVLRRIPTLVSDAFSIFNNTNDYDYKNDTPVKDIQHKDGTVEITLQNDNKINISYEDNQFVYRDSNNHLIDYENTETAKDKTKLYKTTDERFANISFRTVFFGSKTKFDGLLLSINGNSKADFLFKLQSDNTIHMINGNSMKNIDLDDPETIGFKGKEKIASSRGYIWSRSIPIIKDCLLIGKGPDTFPFYFPQNDLIGKLYAYGSATEIVDKPHDLYIQTAISNGLIALLAFLGIIIIYIVDSLKLYALKNKFSESETVGISIFLGIIGYLFAGIFNDSLISVAPVFWIVFGVGFAVNYINRSNNKADK